MIPILYDKTESAFGSNGLGRLRDCISCICSEERNGIYECDFEYPVDGANFDLIQLGRIIAVKHDESEDVQPFDIVSYSRPIDGIVKFHAVHISYRQTALTATGTNINSLADAFTLFGNSSPANPFNYWTDVTSSGFMAAADGIPHSVRTMLGGMEGSVLDTYGGEYEWDKWTVRLWAARGTKKDFTIRYGLNLVDYEEDMDYSDTYTAVIPYWKGQDGAGNDIIVKGDMVQSGQPAFNGMERCVPLDVTDKFDTEGGQPTKAQVEAEGLAYILTNQTYLPAQSIKVDFARITDSSEYSQFANLQKCRLCDSVNVIFSRYKIEGVFKIVKTEYDVLKDRYTSVELGGLSVTLSDALGINQEAANRLRLAAGGSVTDVKVNGSSVVTNGVANVTVPTTAADVGAVPTTRTVNGKALSSDITLTASDVSALPSSTVIPTITDTYNGTSSDGMSGKAVKSAIDALDGTVSGTAGASKTLTAFSQTDGKVSATFGNISITKSQISDFPTIPTVNNATLTIQKNGTNVNTFTTNASSNVTANITVPTTAADVGALPDTTVIPSKLSDLANDMDVSDFPNDANYSSVSVARKTTTGTNIADITIDGTTTQLYAPSGGGGGTTDYDDLTDKPSINSVTLSGNKTTSDLSIHEIPTGGSSGQVLAKSSGTDYDVGWITPSGGVTPDDYVVEQGTADNGKWLYTKWNSGKLEQWYSGNPGSYTVGTTRGQLRSGGNINYTYPVAFTTYPTVVVNATLTTDAYVVWAQASNHSLTGITVRIVASANIAANSNYNIHIYAAGKWK